MTDPAVEAVRRVWSPDWTYIDAGKLTEAAREALKPLREKHYRITVKATSCPSECEVHDDTDCPLDVNVPVCRECYAIAEQVDSYFSERTDALDIVYWPCTTAKLTYPTEELEP